MPSKTVTKPAYQRWLQRRDWAKQRGYNGSGAKMLASNIESFRAAVRHEGFDPDELGDFAKAFERKDRLREVQP